MMTARPAFTGSALWFLGNPTSAEMHEGTLTFTASTPATYHYLCPVPSHAPEGHGRHLHRPVRLRTPKSFQAAGPGDLPLRQAQQLESRQARNALRADRGDLHSVATGAAVSRPASQPLPPVRPSLPVNRDHLLRHPEKVVTPNDFHSLEQLSAPCWAPWTATTGLPGRSAGNSPPATCATSWTASAATSSKTTLRTNRYHRPHDNPRRTSGATHLSHASRPVSLPQNTRFSHTSQRSSSDEV
jgi:hypothetical protein